MQEATNPFRHDGGLARIPKEFITLKRFAKSTCNELGMDQAAVSFIIRTFIKHAPILTIILWENFPEWPVTDTLIRKEKMSIIGNINACSLCMSANKYMECSHIEESKKRSISVLKSGEIIAQYP